MIFLYSNMVDLEWCSFPSRHMYHSLLVSSVISVKSVAPMYGSTVTDSDKR